MRPFSAFILVLCAFQFGGGAAAQEPAEANEPVASEPPDEAPSPGGTRAIDIVLEEPATAAREALLHNARIFDQILVESTEATIRQQKFAAAAGITGGMIMVGLSAWRLLEDDPQSAYSRGLGVMFMTLGMADLTTGVYAATRVPHERHRLERWKTARKNGVSEVELAHFEGELQASQEVRNGERLLVRWAGLTHAIAGVLVLAFTPVPDSSTRTDRVSGYIVGGVFFAVGLGTFAASFRPTPSEKAWEQYNQRKMPLPGHEFSWRLAPSFSRRGAGLSFGATF
jgi:hypothetical protein